MSNKANILPDPMQEVDIVAFDQVAKKHLEGLDLDKLLIYMVNTVDERALIYLARQFNLMGYKGWKLADTVEKKRRLIKNALELHRYKGTVYAIKKSLAALGYPNVTITEHVTHWATFRIQLNIGENILNPDAIAEINSMVMEYKNARSHFGGVEFEVRFGDTLVLEDASSEGYADPIRDGISVGGDFRYNGEEEYDGDKNYSNDTDVLTLIITP